MYIHCSVLKYMWLSCEFLNTLCIVALALLWQREKNIISYVTGMKRMHAWHLSGSFSASLSLVITVTGEHLQTQKLMFIPFITNNSPKHICLSFFFYPI